MSILIVALGIVLVGALAWLFFNLLTSLKENTQSGQNPQDQKGRQRQKHQLQYNRR